MTSTGPRTAGRRGQRVLSLVAALVLAVLLPSATIAWAGLVVDAAVLVGIALAVAVAAAHRDRAPATAAGNG